MSGHDAVKRAEPSEPGSRISGAAGRLAVAMAVAVVAFCAFIPALSGSFLSWDDEWLLVRNAAYRGLSVSHLQWMFTTFHMGHYQPLSWVSFAVDHAVWKMDPAGYHLTNLLLHAANAALLFGVILLFLRAARAGAARATRNSAAMVPAAVAGALFFAIHPLRVESVAWVTERRDVLSGFFLLLSVLAYLRREKEATARRFRWYAASLVCFVLSMLSKAVGMTLPFLLIVLDAYPLRRFKPGAWPRVLLEKVPYLAVALAVAVGAIAAQRSAGAMVGNLGDYSFMQRVAQGAYGLLFYVGKTVLPTGLSPIYPLNRGFDPLGPVFIACGLAVIAVTIGLILCRRRAPWALVAWAAYGLAVAPVLGWAQSGPQIAADRYTYMASMPWSVLIAAGLLRAGSAGVVWRRATRIGGVVVLATLGVLSFDQSRIWRNSFALFDHALKVNPVNPLALLNRGVAWQERGETGRAIEDFSACLRLDPDDANAYNNRAVSRHALGDLDGAIADYGQAIRVSPENAQAYANRGRLKRDRGDAAGALADLEEAIRLDPENAQAYANRGLVRLDSGRGDEAGSDFDRALSLDPGNADAFQGRALVRRMRGDLDGALSDLNLAVEADPTQAQIYSNRGIVRLERGNREGALQDFEAAVRLGPKVASAYANRGFAKLELQDAGGALADFDRSLALAPGDPASRIGRARALAAAGDERAAVAELERLLSEQAPTWPGRAMTEGELAAIRARLGARP